MEQENKNKTKKKASPKKTQQKAKAVTKKKVVSKKVEPKASDKAQENQSKGTKVKEKDFWNETKENINEGAKILSQEAKHIGKKISSYSEVLFGKIKDNTNDAFKYGLDLTNEGVHKAQEMAENLKDDFEVRKLNTKKKEVATQLGMKLYLAIKNNNNTMPDNLLKDKQILSILKELEDIDKEILKLSETEK